jgi:tryptophanyl-tRNA synthetase
MKIKAIEKKYAKVENYGVFKKDLIVIVNEWLSDFQKKYAKAYKDFNKIALKVKANAAFCNKIANKKMQEVYNKIGII